MSCQCNVCQRLPKTADGVPVIPELDYVWHPSDVWEGADPELSKRKIVPRYNGKQKKYGPWRCIPVHWTEWVDAGVGQCYSTFEGALLGEK